MRSALVATVLAAVFRPTEQSKHEQTLYINGRAATCLSMCEQKENRDNINIDVVTSHGHDDPCIYYYQFKDDISADDEVTNVAKKMCECMQCVEDEPLCTSWKKKHGYTLTCTGKHEGHDGMILPEHYLTLKGKDGWKHFLKNHASSRNPNAHFMRIRKLHKGDPTAQDVLNDMKKGPGYMKLLKHFTGCTDPCPENANYMQMRKCCSFMLRKCCYGEDHCETDQDGYIPPTMDLTKYAFRSNHCVGVDSPAPTTSPTDAPTSPPTTTPTPAPSAAPSNGPTSPPSKPPTDSPTLHPTMARCRCLNMKIVRETEKVGGTNLIEADHLKEIPKSSNFYAITVDKLKKYWTYAEIAPNSKQTLIIYFDKQLALWIVGFDMIPGHFLLAIPAIGDAPEYIDPDGVYALDHRKQKVKVKVICNACPRSPEALAKQSTGIHFGLPNDADTQELLQSAYAQNLGHFHNKREIAAGRRRRSVGRPGARRRLATPDVTHPMFTDAPNVTIEQDIEKLLEI